MTRRRPTTRATRIARSIATIAFCALVVLAVAGGCRSPTEDTVDIRTLASCTDMKGVNIIVAPESTDAEERAKSGFPTASTSDCNAGEIGTLVITPNGAAGAVVIVAGFRAPADACKPPDYVGCIVARRRFTFVDHVPVSLPIILDPQCVDVPCGATETCTGKRCVDSSVTCNESGNCTPPGTSVGVNPGGVDGSLGDEDGNANTTSDGPITTTGTDATDGSSTTLSDANRNDPNPVPDLTYGTCSSIYHCPVATSGGACKGEVCCVGTGGGGQATCATATACANFFGYCCTSSSDCPNGTVCCANKLPVTGGAVIACIDSQACSQTPPRAYICHTDSLGAPSPECPLGKSCGPSIYFGELRLCN